MIDPLTQTLWPPAIAPKARVRSAATSPSPHGCCSWCGSSPLSVRNSRIAAISSRAPSMRSGPRARPRWPRYRLFDPLRRRPLVQRAPGIIDSGVAGLILGAAYLAAGRNLWVSILAHGLIDTTGVTLVYLGFDS